VPETVATFHRERQVLYTSRFLPAGYYIGRVSGPHAVLFVHSETNTALTPFTAQAFLDTAGVPRKVMDYRRGESIYSQGEAPEAVMYLQKGGMKLSVVNGSGKQAVVAMFGPGDFVGERCMAGPSHDCSWSPRLDSYSPDLCHWGSHKLMLEARRGAWWGANKIGMSPPPIETSRGWLMIYHGVRRTPSSSIYRLGLSPSDLEQPEK